MTLPREQQLAEAYTIGSTGDALALARVAFKAAVTILWYYDSTHDQFIGIDTSGVDGSRNRFVVPRVDTDGGDTAREIAGVLRPESAEVIYDRHGESVWPSQTQETKLRPRGVRTLRENAGRSCVAFPITSEGYLPGAITAYSHRPGRELVGIRNYFCATLSFTLQGLLRSRQESIRIEELEANFDVLHAHLCGNRRLRSHILAFWEHIYKALSQGAFCFAL